MKLIPALRNCNHFCSQLAENGLMYSYATLLVYTGTPLGRWHSPVWCFYTKAHRMGKKQEELEATMLLESSVAITDTSWGEFHDWSVAVDGYRLFIRDRKGRRGRGVALDIQTRIKHEELPLKNSQEQVESLWVKIRERGNKGNFIVVVYTTGQPIQGSLWMKPSYSSYRMHHAHKLHAERTGIVKPGKEKALG